jgi:hypothetical protein
VKSRKRNRDGKIMRKEWVFEGKGRGNNSERNTTI